MLPVSRFYDIGAPIAKVKIRPKREGITDLIERWATRAEGRGWPGTEFRDSGTESIVGGTDHCRRYRIVVNYTKLRHLPGHLNHEETPAILGFLAISQLADFPTENR